MKDVKIKVEFSLDGIDPDGVLEQEHVVHYTESLKEEIEAEHPDAEVIVEQGIDDGVDVITDSWSDYGVIGCSVNQIIADHWQPWIDRVAGDMEV